MDTDQIVKVLHWRPKRPDECRSLKELADYRYNEDPPADAEEIEIIEDSDWDQIPEFSHARVFLEDGTYFNVWADLLRVICVDLKEIGPEHYEKHSWMSDAGGFEHDTLSDLIGEIMETPTELARPQGIENPHMVKWELRGHGTVYPYQDEVAAKKFEKAFKKLG